MEQVGMTNSVGNNWKKWPEQPWTFTTLFQHVYHLTNTFILSMDLVNMFINALSPLHGYLLNSTRLFSSGITVPISPPNGRPVNVAGCYSHVAGNCSDVNNTKHNGNNRSWFLACGCLQLRGDTFYKLLNELYPWYYFLNVLCVVFLINN